MSFKKAKVVMLPTAKESNIMLGREIFINMRGEMRGQCFHLYILSDEEIKEGDWKNPGWYIDFRVANKPVLSNTPIHQYKVNACKKVIATTNKSLEIETDITNGMGNCIYFRLPSPSSEFTQKFIEEYNKGNIITDVMVEYEEYGTIAKDFKDVNFRLKVDKNNCITIRKCKESWNREEVKNLIQKALAEFQNKPHSYTEYSNWIENNL